MPSWFYTFVVSILLASLTGCGTVRLPGSGRAGDAPLILPPACQRMVTLARQEWTLFGGLELNETSDHPSRRFRAGAPFKQELDPAMLPRVLAYWTGLATAPVSRTQGPLRPWSGAFIHWLARSGGLDAQAFPATALHWDYIEQFMTLNPKLAFAARDVSQHAPQVGDLVCSTRDPALEAAGRPLGMLPLRALRRGTYHCDLVVSTPPGEVHLIGGNVSDTVALTKVASDQEGHLRPDRRRVWATVLAQRTPPRTGAPAASQCAQ